MKVNEVKKSIKKPALGLVEGILPGFVGTVSIVRSERSNEPSYPPVDFTIHYIVIYWFLDSTEPLWAYPGAHKREKGLVTRFFTSLGPNLEILWRR